MTLKERYSGSELSELIQIIENKSDYTEECVSVVKNEFESRKIIDGSSEKIAEELIRGKFKTFLEKFDPFSSKITIYESTFLSKEQIKEIQKDEFDKWMDKREGFEFDVWNYAIGGAL